MMMKNIGIDFDNTIITYDEVFHKYARKLGLISPEVRKNKKAIRDTIRVLPKGNDKWTELQGLVYGKYMAEAKSMHGVGVFLKTCKKNSFEVSIISHKTVYPASGPRINLQVAAHKWLEKRGFFSYFGLTESDVVFEKTLQGKLNQIAKKKCDYFIDDLIEILVRPDFPKGVRKILYGQQVDVDLPNEIMCFKNWNEITEYFFG